MAGPPRSTHRLVRAPRSSGCAAHATRASHPPAVLSQAGIIEQHAGGVHLAGHCGGAVRESVPSTYPGPVWRPRRPMAAGNVHPMEPWWRRRYRPALGRSSAVDVRRRVPGACGVRYAHEGPCPMQLDGPVRARSGRARGRTVVQQGRTSALPCRVRIRKSPRRRRPHR